ncbi:MAG: type II secretion system protein GspM [Rhodospirillales bacterium]|nr:type II secretion system protein GspM [Rhodospirillales bacterium]
MSKGVKRAAALALLFLVLWLAWIAVVSPVISAYRETNERIASTSERLNRFQGISNNYPALKQQIEDLVRQTAKSGIYLAGNTDSLAAANLQEGVSGTIERNGGTLRSVQILPVTDDGDFRKVTVRVQMTATLPAFTRILYSLEADKPFVFIDNLDIKNRRARARNQDEDQNPELVIRFDLYGYLRPSLS